MGGRPIMALAILGMPIDKIPAEIVREILKGGAAVCADAGIPVAGGHSIDSPEPIYGLAVVGTCRRTELRRKCDAKPGDMLILTKALGVGIYSAAFKKGALSADAYTELIASTTLLKRIGADLACDASVHAITDVHEIRGVGEEWQSVGVDHKPRLRAARHFETVTKETEAGG
jgi:selenide,water dikinase